jgi:O-methyltransferase
LRRVFTRYPQLQPVMRDFYGLFVGRRPPNFTGWLMSTDHELPWTDDNDWEDFRRTLVLLRELEYAEPSQVATIDALAWRHWNVAYAVRHAVRHSGADQPAFVECGVADGMTAFVALREKRPSEYHLFDSWEPMTHDLLTAGESDQAGRYAAGSLNRALRNLSEFSEVLKVHKGFIPATLEGEPPKDLAFVHIDLNSSGPTLGALNYFWPSLLPGGVILFDDYGWRYYHETRKVIDAFFCGKPGTLLKLPTGQAMYFSVRGPEHGGDGIEPYDEGGSKK